MFSLQPRTLPTLVAILGLSTPGLLAADAPRPDEAPTWQLAFKFTPEQVVRYEDRFHSTIRLQKANKTVRILNNRKSRKHYRVLSVDKKGQGLVETVIDHIKIRAQQGDEPAINIDSSDGPDSCPVNFRTLLATIGRPIARSRCDIEQCRLLTLQAAEVMDRDGLDGARPYISMIKIVAPKMAQEVADRAMQIFGGMGVCQDTLIPEVFTIGRFCRIADGPDEVHMSQLGKLTARELTA